MTKRTNKVAIITGASSGIGQGIAEGLASEGINVVLAARREDLLQKLVHKINEQGKGKAHAVVTDITKSTDANHLIKEATTKFGPIDILINNAGVMGNGEVLEGKVEKWEQMIDVNVKGTLYAIHACLPDMLERGTGHIINTASVSATEVTKTSTVYSATKVAVKTISMGLEKELARTGVRVTNLTPGMVKTERNENLVHKANRKPLETADIASAVIYAISQPAHVNVNEITIRPV